MSTVGEFLKPYITNVTDRVSEALEKEAQAVVAEVRAMYLDALRPSAELRAKELTQHLRKAHPEIFGGELPPPSQQTDAPTRDGGDKAFPRIPPSSSSFPSVISDAAAARIAASSSSSSSSTSLTQPAAAAANGKKEDEQENVVVRALRGVAVEAFRAAVEDMLKKTIVPALQNFADTLQTSVVEEVPVETDEFMKTLLETHVTNLVRATRAEIDRRRKLRQTTDPSSSVARSSSSSSMGGGVVASLGSTTRRRRQNHHHHHPRGKRESSRVRAQPASSSMLLFS